MEIKKQKYIGIFSIILILIFSISSYKLIPFGTPDGLDFHNVYSYATCDEILEKSFNDNIYLASGTDCGDAMGRPFVYPPLLFFSAKWVGFFQSFESARLAWRLLIIVGTLLCIYIWVGKSKDFLLTLPFTLLLFFQFPMLFALERGNNDILVLFAWTIFYYFYRRKQLKLAGFFAASSVLMKIYPLFSFIIVATTIFFKETNKNIKRFSLGTLMGGLVIFLAFSKHWYSFYLKLSSFAGGRMVLDILNHSVQYLTNSKLINFGIFLILIFSWVMGYLNRGNDKAISCAGALAVSTYYSATSFDYNLITAYPLLVLLLIKQCKSFSRLDFFMYLILIVSLLGNRYWFNGHGDLGFKVHIYGQVISLIYFGATRVTFFKLRMYISYHLKIRGLINA